MREMINLNDMLKWDSTILDDYELPDTIYVNPDYQDEPTYSITLDHDIMSSNIMIRCGLLTPRYNEPDVFKAALNLWFKTHKWNIEHLMRLACQNYNPLENYDRWEHLKGTNTLGGSDREVHSGQDVEQSGGTVTQAHSGTDTTEETTSAMNSSTYQPADRSTLQHGETITTTSNNTDTTTHGENINTQYGKTDSNVDNNHIHGNIGVTTFTQMANQEIDLANTFNIYQNIVSLIENDLFICVY